MWGLQLPLERTSQESNVLIYKLSCLHHLCALFSLHFSRFLNYRRTTNPGASLSETSTDNHLDILHLVFNSTDIPIPLTRKDLPMYVFCLGLWWLSALSALFSRLQTCCEILPCFSLLECVLIHVGMKLLSGWKRRSPLRSSILNPGVLFVFASEVLFYLDS